MDSKELEGDLDSIEGALMEGESMEEAGNGISSGSSSDIKLMVGDLMEGTTEGIRTTLMSSGSEPSFNDDKVGVLVSEGISPSSIENASAVM